MPRKFAFAVLAAVTLGPAHVNAQGAAGAVVPRQGTPIPQIAPSAPPRVGPGVGLAPPPAPAEDAALSATVPIQALEIEGATAFPRDRLVAAAGPLVGAAVPLRQIEAARAAILGLYREAGYVFTTVDAVVEPGGRLRIVVNEAQVTDVRLDGDIGPAGTQVLRFLNNLVGVRPVSIATLERWLLLAEDVPGVSVRTILRPAGTVPGALSLVAQVARRPVTGYLAADNRGFRLTGPQQFLAAAQFNSFTEFGERTELSLFYAAGATQLFGQAATEFFVGGSGTRVRLYAGVGESTPSDELRAIGYQGETAVAGIAAAYPLIRRRQQTLVLSGAFDVIESEIRLEDDVFGSRQLSRDSLRVVRLGGEWTVYDQFLGDERGAVNALALRLSQGLSAFGASESGSPDLSRANAETDFTKLAFDLTRAQTLFSPWPGATVVLQGTIAGQWTDDVLPQAEKFYLGGSRLGRGYYAGEITGDRALAGSVELQLALNWETPLFGRSVRVDPLLYTFYDIGRTWENQAVDPDRRLFSAGLGARFSITENAEFQLEGVRRFERRPGGAQADEFKRDALFWRVLFRL